MADQIPLPHAPRLPMLVVGSVAYDEIETPFGNGSRLLGGSASFASLAASYFTGVRMVGVVGDDFAERDMARLRRQGIDLDGLQIDRSGKTFTWAGRYHENFDRRDTIDTQLNVFERFRPDLPPAWRATRYAMLGNIHPALQHFVLDQLEPGAFVLADTMDLWIRADVQAVLALGRRVDLLVINDSESEQITGERNPIRAAAALLDAGCRGLVIKKGSHGSLVFTAQDRFALPAFPVTDLRDPTGAGDSFAGALLGYLAAVDDRSPAALRRAIVHATATASLTVEAFSCDRLESAGAAEIARRVATLVELTRIP